MLSKKHANQREIVENTEVIIIQFWDMQSTIYTILYACMFMQA